MFDWEKIKTTNTHLIGLLNIKLKARDILGLVKMIQINETFKKNQYGNQLIP